MAVPSPFSKDAMRTAALDVRRSYAASLTPELRADLEASLAAIVLPHLLGARIVRMKDDERERYLAYLDTLVRRERRTRASDASPATPATRQAGMWESVTPVYVTEAFEKFLRESAPPRRS